MAGTLTISTLSDGTNSTSSTNCIQGSAKSWVRFAGSGSSATINASYNVSSVTRNGTGDYTINFTNALTDGNYSVVVMANAPSYNTSACNPGTLASSSAQIFITGILGSSNNRIDATVISAVILR
jgi:hypothetical protein